MWPFKRKPPCQHVWIAARNEYLDVYYVDDVKCGGYWRTYLICVKCGKRICLRTDEWEAIQRYRK